MNYKEMGFRENYNEIMFSERDVIEKFLKDQYDIRYGRQRDSWAISPSVALQSTYPAIVFVDGVRLDKNKIVLFDVITQCGKREEWECSQFHYGELQHVIEALPEVEDIVWNNAISDLKEQNSNLRVDLLLKEHPFIYEVGGQVYHIDDIEVCDDDILRVGTTPVSDIPVEVLEGLRDHIHIEHLHKTKEYKDIMAFLALQPNLRKDIGVDPNSLEGLIQFTLDKTDLVFEAFSITRYDNGNLTIYGADKDNLEDTITLTEKDINEKYLEVILALINERSNIIDTYNGHNEELVRKINSAWRDTKYHNKFSEILLALLVRDHEEYIDKYCEIEDYSGDWAMAHAHEIMEGVCDDQDLECILNFIRYEEND